MGISDFLLRLFGHLEARVATIGRVRQRGSQVAVIGDPVDFPRSISCLFNNLHDWKKPQIEKLRNPPLTMTVIPVTGLEKVAPESLRGPLGRDTDIPNGTIARILENVDTAVVNQFLARILRLLVVLILVVHRLIGRGRGLVLIEEGYHVCYRLLKKISSF